MSLFTLFPEYMSFMSDENPSEDVQEATSEAEEAASEIADENTDAIQEDAQIEMIFREFDQLDRIQMHIQKYGLSKDLAIFHADIFERLGAIPSVESLDTVGVPQSATSIAAQESVGDAVRSIWNFLIRIIKKILEWIVRFFKWIASFFTNEKKRSATIFQQSAQISKAVAALPNGALAIEEHKSEELKIWEPETLFAFFRKYIDEPFDLVANHIPQFKLNSNEMQGALLEECKNYTIPEEIEKAYSLIREKRAGVKQSTIEDLKKFYNIVLDQYRDTVLKCERLQQRTQPVLKAIEANSKKLLPCLTQCEKFVDSLKSRGSSNAENFAQYLSVIKKGLQQMTRTMSYAKYVISQTTAAAVKHMKMVDDLVAKVNKKVLAIGQHNGDVRNAFTKAGIQIAIPEKTSGGGVRLEDA